VLLVTIIFYTPVKKSRFLADEMPRSVKLVATLDVPAPKPKPVRRAAPRPKPRPRVVTPAPAPTVMESKVAIPVKEAPPLLKRRQRSPDPVSLKDRMSSRLSEVQPKTVETTEPELSTLEIAKVAPLESASKAPASAVAKDRIATASSFPYDWYKTQVWQQVYSRWRAPSSFSLGGRQRTAVASFNVARDGRLERIRITESSGHRLFDQSVMVALTGLGKLPPLPKGYKDDYVEFVISFTPQNR